MKKAILSLAAMILTLFTITQTAFADDFTVLNDDDIDWTKSIIYQGENIAPDTPSNLMTLFNGDINIGFSFNTTNVTRINLEQPLQVNKFAAYARRSSTSERGTWVRFLNENDEQVGFLYFSTGQSYPSLQVSGDTNITVSSILIDPFCRTSQVTNCGAITLTQIGLFVNPDAPPTTPTGLTAQTGMDQIILNWDANYESNLAGYNVYVDGVKVNASLITDTSYTVTGLTPETEYSISITAVNTSDIESSQTTPILVMTTPIPVVPPDPPTGLNATAGVNRVLLKWLASTDINVAGYNVYVDGVKENFNLIKNTTYTVTGLTSDKTYDFFVTSVSTNNIESVPSSTVQAIPLPDKSIDLNTITPLASITDVIGTAVSFIRTVVPDWLLVGLGIIFAYIIIRFLYWIVQKIRTEAFNRKNLNKESIVKAAKDGTLTKWTGKRDADGNRIREKVSEKEAAKLIKKYDRKDRIDRMSTKEFDERIGREERQKMYDYLTAKGRISERDAWVRNTGTWGIKQRDGRSGRSVRPGRDSSR